MKKLGAALTALALTWTISGTALADVERSTYTKDGDIHEFKDDPLHSNAQIPGGGTIRVRPNPFRSYLIRPRTTFVPEMLKSVERI
jgi:hypothetical protein